LPVGGNASFGDAANHGVDAGVGWGGSSHRSPRVQESGELNRPGFLGGSIP
jgi:hypothetical protein